MINYNSLLLDKNICPLAASISNGKTIFAAGTDRNDFEGYGNG